MNHEARRCCVCGKFITQNARGVWIDAGLTGECANATGFHQPDQAMITMAVEAGITVGESLVLPKGTAMFVVAVDHDSTIMSMSGLIDRRSTPTIVAGIRELADQWEHEYNDRIRAALN